MAGRGIKVAEKEKFGLKGYDTFEGAFYSLDGEYSNEAAAIKAAKRRLQYLEKTQPSEESGGQDGIQDQVYVVRPDGSQYRFLQNKV